MTCFDFSPDGRRLATGGKDGEVKLWSLESGTDGMQATLIAQLVQKNEGIVQALRFNPDGHQAGGGHPWGHSYSGSRSPGFWTSRCGAGKNPFK